MNPSLTCLCLLLALHGGAVRAGSDTNALPAPPADAAAAEVGATPRAALEKLKRKYGERALYEVDETLKLVFATTADRHTMEELKARLSDFARATRRDLFAHGLETYCAIAVPEKWPGDRVSGHFYPGWVDARTLGPTLLHEFTHALHFADQDPRGQLHNVWVIEGLASLLEYAKVVNGHLAPRHNHQLRNLKEDLIQRKNVPWEQMIKFERRQFHSSHYAQARYMLFYLFEKGLLKAWYDAYCAGFAGDPTGGAALEQAFGKKLADIDKEWLAWVQQLPSPPVSGPGSASLGVVSSQVADGLQVAGFAPDSAAEKAGLKVGDVLVCVNGERIIEREELAEAILRHQVGDAVRIDYRRGPGYTNAAVTLAPLVLSPPEPPPR